MARGQNPESVRRSGRIGGLRLRATHHSDEYTVAGRAAFLRRFEREVDLDGSLSLPDRMGPNADYEASIKAAAEEFASAIVTAVRAELTRQAPAGPVPDRLYSIDEAAEVLGVARSTLYGELIATGRLRTLKVGRRRLVAASAIGDYIEAVNAKDALASVSAATARMSEVLGGAAPTR